MTIIEVLALIFFSASIIFIPRMMYTKNIKAAAVKPKQAKAPYTYFGLMFIYISICFSLLYFTTMNLSVLKLEQVYFVAPILFFVSAGAYFYAKRDMREQ